MHSSNLILKGEHQGSKLSKEIKFGKAYSGEERYFAQLALNKLSFLVYNRQLTDTSQLLHKLDTSKNLGGRGAI
jgi:hypothetical protein